VLAGVSGRARQHTLKLRERGTDLESSIVEPVLPDFVLVPPRALFQH
jgi:hypothetical protein